MSSVLAGLVLSGLIPLGVAFWASRQTSLAHALIWAMLAWLSWAAAIWVDDSDSAALPPARYLALCMTGCAGVAVLGARRPHVVAWDFVVISLLAVMLLPLAEAQLLGTHSTEGLRVLFLAGTIVVGVLNYLPTRLGPAAFVLTVGIAIEISRLAAPAWAPGRETYWLVVGTQAAAPWIAWLCWRLRPAEKAEFDRLWLDFRDAWGMVWSQRAREQFNHAAENAGWPVTLSWRGLRPSDGEEDRIAANEEKYLVTLRAILQRFLAADQNL